MRYEVFYCIRMQAASSLSTLLLSDLYYLVEPHNSDT